MRPLANYERGQTRSATKEPTADSHITKGLCFPPAEGKCGPLVFICWGGRTFTGGGQVQRQTGEEVMA